MKEDLKKSKKMYNVEIGSSVVTNFPQYLIRPDDKMKFVHVADGFYALELHLLEWPEHFHFYHPYDTLIKLKFYEEA